MPMFVATTNDISSGTASASVPQMLIRNPSGSDKTVLVTSLILSTTVSSGNNIFRIYKDPIASNDGTVIVPGNINITSGFALPPRAVNTKVPTVAANNLGTLMMTFCVGPTSAMIIPVVIPIKPGESYLILVRPNSANMTFSACIFWDEK